MGWVGRYEESLQTLMDLQDYAPRESGVHFLMGKIYRKMQQPDVALAKVGTLAFHHSLLCTRSR